MNYKCVDCKHVFTSDGLPEKCPKCGSKKWGKVDAKGDWTPQGESYVRKFHAMFNEEAGNKQKFQDALESAYKDLFANDPDYAYSAAKTTPESLAAKMTAGLATGGANHAGIGIKRACKAVGIKHTLTAIMGFLKEDYQEKTPEHKFEPVKGQTGCAKCGYAQGHHPNFKQLKVMQKEEITKRALIRDPETPVGQPGKMHINCGCGTKVPMTDKGGRCEKCGQKYDGRGWLTESWKVEVIADNSGKWATNSMRYASKEEAEAAGRSLESRWMAVREMRVTETDDPVYPPKKVTEEADWGACDNCGKTSVPLKSVTLRGEDQTWCTDCIEKGKKGQGDVDKFRKNVGDKSDKPLFRVNEVTDLIVKLREKDFESAQRVFAELMQEKVNTLLVEERRTLLAEVKYHTCSECEANFESVDGKFPSHKFNGKPCSGSGQVIKEGVTLTNKSPFNVSTKSKDIKIQKEDSGPQHICHIPGNTKPCPACPKSMGGTLKETESGVKDHRYDRELAEAKMTWWKVMLNGKEIDKIQYTSDQSAEDVKRSLVNHDGYDSDIKVIKEAVVVTEEKLSCQECGKAFNGSVKGEPKCPKCGSYDIELAEAVIIEEGLVDTIRSGDRVTIVNRFGQESTGRAVMKGPAGWVLNMGGAHGTPGIASDSNIVKVKSMAAKTVGGLPAKG